MSERSQMRVSYHPDFPKDIKRLEAQSVLVCIFRSVRCSRRNAGVWIRHRQRLRSFDLVGTVRARVAGACAVSVGKQAWLSPPAESLRAHQVQQRTADGEREQIIDDVEHDEPAHLP